MLRLALALLLVLGTCLASAQDSPTPPPDPQHLAADWWSYFEPKEALDTEKSEQRINAAQKWLNGYREQLGNNAGDKAQAKLIEKVSAELARYWVLRNAPTPVSKAVEPAEAGYSLAAALERHAAWRVLQQEVNAEREEADWQSVVINEARKQQSRRRNQYLAFEDTDPGRVTKGLELMLDRIGVEIQRAEFNRRKAVLRGAEQRLDMLHSELDVIPARLVVSAADSKHWQHQLATAETAIGKLQEQLDQSRLFDLKVDESAQDVSEAQYAMLVAVHQDIEVWLNELAATEARLALAIIPLVTKSTTDATQAAQPLLDEQSELQTKVQQQRARWQRIADHNRSVAAIKVPGSSEDAQAQNLRDQTLKTLDDIDQALLQLDRQVPATGFMAELLRARQQATENWLERYLADARNLGGKSWITTVNALGATLFELNETPVTTLGLIRVVVILTITLWLSRIIRRTISRVGERRGGISQSSLYTFGRLVHYVLLMIGIIIGLSSIGLDFTKFALFASALGVGIGFGLQTLISNFVSGLIILFEKSLKVGDFVELESGVTGEVREINMRSTLITTNDNVDILVPNSEFVGGRVINWTLLEAHRRIRVPFGVAYGTDKELVRKAILEAADNVKWTLQNVKGRQPQVWFVQFGDSSLNFELIVWLTPEAVKRPAAVQAAYLWEIESKLGEYHIEIPFPQRDLHVRSLFGMKNEQAAQILMRSPRGDSS